MVSMLLPEELDTTPVSPCFSTAHLKSNFLLFSTKEASATRKHIWKKKCNVWNSTCSGLMGSVVVKMSE